MPARFGHVRAIGPRLHVPQPFVRPAASFWHDHYGNGIVECLEHHVQQMLPSIGALVRIFKHHAFGKRPGVLLERGQCLRPILLAHRLRRSPHGALYVIPQGGAERARGKISNAVAQKEGDAGNRCCQQCRDDPPDAGPSPRVPRQLGAYPCLQRRIRGDPLYGGLQPFAPGIFRMRLQ